MVSSPSRKKALLRTIMECNLRTVVLDHRCALLSDPVDRFIAALVSCTYPHPIESESGHHESAGASIVIGNGIGRRANARAQPTIAPKAGNRLTSAASYGRFCI
jgi:hypothetical protein